MFNATFSNISAISWRPVLVPGERTTDHMQATGKLYIAAGRVHPFCILQIRARTHAVIGLYELLSNPTMYLTH